MDQICINNAGNIAALVAMAITAASGVANFVPAPNEISNPVGKFLSKALHFLAVDVVTAVKK